MPIDLGSPHPKQIRADIEKVVFNVIDKHYLPRPATPIERDFFSVVASRCSRRDYLPLRDESLANLLWYSAHPRSVKKDDQGHEIQFRPAPSAGGLHPIELIIIHPSQSQWLPYVYEPKAHCLCQFSVGDGALDSFAFEVEEVLPIQQGTIIWLAADFNKTQSKYNHAESLVWRDAGVLIGHMALVAEALSLAFCPLGITGEPSLSECILPSTNLVGVGGMIVGER